MAAYENERQIQMELKKQKWIPWQRFLIQLRIDKKNIVTGRFGMGKTAIRFAERLSAYKGYETTVYDTKTCETIFPLEK